MLIVTGGAGFIGSALIWGLNVSGHNDIMVVDTLGKGEKWRNLWGLKFSEFVHKDDFRRRLESRGIPPGTECVFHMGACSATTETDGDYLLGNNYEYSRLLARHCVEAGVRFIAASSAATYGDGAHGYVDNPDVLDRLRPLNMYGYSKQLFDLWARDEGYLDAIASLKFFNVFGPNEYHKGDMSSVILKAFRQINQRGYLELFRSHRPEYADGEQMRDFVYVKDVVEVMLWLAEHEDANGIFNVGCGEARTWNDLARSVFAAMDRPADIRYIDMPLAIRGNYQYHTVADIGRLRQAGYTQSFRSLEEGAADYVRNYLARGERHLDRMDP